MRLAVRWRNDFVELFLGPEGIAIGERIVVPGPLTVGVLGVALRAVELPAGSRVLISIDDVWVPGLLIDRPELRLARQELDALVAHRVREVFGLSVTEWPRLIAERSALPWPFSRLTRSGSFLVSACPGGVSEALRAWSRERKIRLIGLAGCWAHALARVGRCRTGVLAVYRGKRMTVGAWSESGWLGWRSFVAPDPVGAQATLWQWLDGLHWKASRVPVWCSGWQAGEPQGKRWDVCKLPVSSPAGRASLFNFFAIEASRQAIPMRQKMLAVAGGLTLLACLWVALPEWSLQQESEIAVPTRRVQAVSGAASTEAQGNPEADQSTGIAELDELPTWPVILGFLEQRGRRHVLFSTSQDSASLPVGGVIDGRFRIDRASAEAVVLTDTRTMEQREILLGNAGALP